MCQNSNPFKNWIISHCINMHIIKSLFTCWKNLDNLLKSKDISLPTKVHRVKYMFFSSSHVWMWKLDHKEVWVLKDWYSWIVVLEKTLESPLGWKVNPKGNQSWILIGRNDADTEAPILWPPDRKSWLLEKDPEVGKDWTLKRRGWQRVRLLNSMINSMTQKHESEQTQGDSEGRGTWHVIVPGVERNWTWLSD